MSDKTDNKNLWIIIGAVAVLVVGYYLYQQSQKESVTLSIGDQSISATVE
ncbi:MAG: hypothetical protein KDJ35_09255 [Alphaproteobacteria bacterium]|nr:hypothetical protein [Alphaproteobacteria bacterium]